MRGEQPNDPPRNAELRLPHVPPVYTGENTITVNADTMNRIVSEWLHNYHSGGPYKVTSVDEVSNANGTGFAITFHDEPVPATAEAAK